MYRSREGPLFPRSSPDEKRVAFVDGSNMPRLTVLEASGEVRDLGAALADCSPRWAGTDRIWVLHGSDLRPQWVELNAQTGELTGRQADAGPRREEADGCHFVMVALPGLESELTVFASTREEAEIRICEARLAGG
jgi:hypothetical protein